MLKRTEFSPHNHDHTRDFASKHQQHKHIVNNIDESGYRLCNQNHKINKLGIIPLDCNEYQKVPDFKQF